MKTLRIVMPLLLLISLCSVSFAQTRRGSGEYPSRRNIDRDRLDAAIILQGTTRDGVIPEPSLASIARDLRAIRATSPDIRDVHAFGPVPDTLRMSFAWPAAQMLLKTSPEIAEAFANGAGSYDGKKNESITLYKMKGLQTGNAQLDRLNQKYGALRLFVSMSAPSEYSAGYAEFHVIFPQMMDVATLASRYQAALRGLLKNASGEGSIGDGSRIYRFAPVGEPTHYRLESRGGDCPAGCTTSEEYSFDVKADGSVVALAPLKAGESRWGIPGRYYLAPYANGAALIAELSDPSWEKRLMAIGLLSLMLERRAIPHYEEKESANPAVVNHAQKIVAELDAQTPALLRKLARIARTDTDLAVRIAARKAIEKQRYGVADRIARKLSAEYHARGSKRYFMGWDLVSTLRYPAPWYARVLGRETALQKDIRRLLREDRKTLPKSE